MGMTRREHFAHVLNRLYPGEQWTVHDTEDRYSNAAGLALDAAEIATNSDGVALKTLIDAKRDAFEVSQLENAATWLNG